MITIDSGSLCERFSVVLSLYIICLNLFRTSLLFKCVFFQACESQVILDICVGHVPAFRVVTGMVRIRAY